MLDTVKQGIQQLIAAYETEKMERMKLQSALEQSLANEETSCGNPDWVQPLAEGWVDESIRWIKAVKSY